ncbi:MAG: RsmB/NOP family class I SAM-dependent RNA methyltransferase [Candidatus Thermoplasmatota archaeon]
MNRSYNTYHFFQKRYTEIGGKIKPFQLYRCIRVNTKKISSENLKKRLLNRGFDLEKIPFVPHGFRILKEPFNLVSCPEYLLGLFYIQDAASQLPAQILSPRELVLDACAAPGGKTCQLASMANVIAVDNNKQRFQKLRLNLERLGIDNCIAYNMDFLKIQTCFNYILLDAPCSGNYMLESRWFEKNTLQRITERSQLQKRLVAHAISLLNPGGILVYSTCSLEPEEDECVVQYALDTFPIKLEKINCIGDPGLTTAFQYHFDESMRYCRRLWPDKTETIGFFIARLKKC